MAEKEVLLTAEGLKKLESELEILKTVKRREIAERINTSLDFGDISENAEYDNAKNEQAFIEGRIAKLEKTLRNAKVVINEDGPRDTVGVGITVKLRDLDLGDEFEYTIVGSTEADPAQAKISLESPVGEALMGKKVGDVVEVRAPVGLIKYEILELR